MPSNRAAALQVVDPLLTTVARRYQPTGFIAGQLTSDVAVNTMTGKYVIFTDQYWFQSEVETLHKDRDTTRHVDYEWSTDSFSIEEHRLAADWTDLEVEQAGAAQLDLERDKTEFLAHRFELAREIRIANLLLPTGSGGALNLSSTPSVNWDQATATIEADIKTGVLNVYDTIGIVPNVIVIPYKVAYAMAVQEDIREILKYTVNGQDVIRLGDRVLPSSIHGMRVVIPQGAQKDSAREGGTASRSEIWGDDVRLLYIDEQAGRYKPSVLKRFLHTGKTVKRWRTDDPDLTNIRLLERHDEKVVAPDAGHVLLDTLS